MRKFALLFFVVIFSFSGCQGEPSAIVVDFTADAYISYNDIEIKGKVVSNKNNMLTFTVNEPESISGCAYSYKDDKIKISYGNININGDEEYLYEKSFVRILYEAIITLKDIENYRLTYYDNALAQYDCYSDNFNYSVVAEYNTGIIKTITVDELNFYAEFYL